MDHMGNIGAFELEATIPLLCPCANSSGVPTAPDAAPTWKILNSAGTEIANGTLSTTDSAGLTGVRTGTTTAAAASGFAPGNVYSIIYSYAINSQARSAVAFLSVI